MQRYLKLEDAKVGDKILLNNTVGVVKEIPKTNVVGEIIKIEDENLIVEVNDDFEDGQISITIPYYLAQ